MIVTAGSRGGILLLLTCARHSCEHVYWVVSKVIDFGQKTLAAPGLMKDVGCFASETRRATRNVSRVAGGLTSFGFT